MIQKVLGNMLYETAQPFVGDIVGTIFKYILWTSFRSNRRFFFQKIRNAGLGLRMDKCKWCFQEITFLGTICNSEYCRSDPCCFRKLEQLLKCDSKRALKSCLCYLSYHRNFIPAFSEISYPIREMVNSGPEVPFEMTEEIQNAIKSFCLLYTSPSPRD